eukprot:9475356-Pyramimonas_sp.AAC.3
MRTPSQTFTDARADARDICANVDAKLTSLRRITACVFRSSDRVPLWHARDLTRICATKYEVL